MKTTRLTIRGAQLSVLPRAIEHGLKEIDYELHSILSPNFTILAIETYYFLSKSTVLSFVVLDTSHEGRLELEVVSGGGANLFSIAWGGHRDSIGQIIDVIKSVCAERSLTIDVPDE